MSQRISLGGGKYCYSGANCSWHSPNGISAGRKNLREAERRLWASTTLEEVEEAKKLRAIAQKQYDANSEGQKLLAEAIEREDDELEKHRLEVRLAEAKKTATEREEIAQERMEAEAVAFTNNDYLSKNEELLEEILNESNREPHTYNEPTFHMVGNETGAPVIVGSNYIEGEGVKKVAPRLEAELSKAAKEGYIPENLEYNVSSNITRRSVSINAVGMKADEIRDSSGLTDEARVLTYRLNKISDSFRTTANDSQNPNPSHFSHVKLETPDEAEYREDKERFIAMRNETLSTREQLKAERISLSLPELDSKYELDFKSSNKLSSGEPYSPVKGHDSIIAVKTLNGSRMAFYDLSALALRREETGEVIPLTERLKNHELSSFRKSLIQVLMVEKY